MASLRSDDEYCDGGGWHLHGERGTRGEFIVVGVDAARGGITACHKGITYLVEAGGGDRG